MNTTYAIDLSLKPTTFDLWHVCLASTVFLLSLILIALLLAMVVSFVRCKNRPKAHSIQQATQVPEPVVKIVEKIVEVDLVGDERKLMDESISHVKDLVGAVRKIFPDLA